MQNNNYIVVVAHPDDEILWASSICEKASKVIICFSEDEQSEKISKGRNYFSKNAPDNFYFLGIKEPDQKYVTFIHKKSHIRKCISDKSFKKIKNNLLNLIDCPNVYTHNYWGEYGHPQHIAIHLIVRSICKAKKLKLKMFSYFNLKTFLSRNNYMHKNYLTLERKKVSKKFFYSLKNKYVNAKCWTFPKSYSPPKYEYFYEINQKLKPNCSLKYKLPGVYIFWGQIHYILKFKHISVKDFKFLFLIILIDLALIPLYFTKYLLRKFSILKK